MAAADYVFASKDYLREKLELQTAEAFFRGILAQQWGEDWTKSARAFICPWGTDGVYYLDMSSRSTHHIAAERLDTIVESVGAGDTFIGAAIAGLSSPGCSLDRALRLACLAATTKCTQQGFKLPDNLVAKWRRELQRDGKSTSFKQSTSTNKMTHQAAQ